MKKLLSSTLCVAVIVLLFACQKSHDLAATDQKGELLTTTTSGTTMESGAVASVVSRTEARIMGSIQQLAECT